MRPLISLASLILSLAATTARAADVFNPDCAAWQGSTKPTPPLCKPLPQEALSYAKQCLRIFADKLDPASPPGGCMRLFGAGGGNQTPHYPDIGPTSSKASRSQTPASTRAASTFTKAIASIPAVPRPPTPPALPPCPSTISSSTKTS